MAKLFRILLLAFGLSAALQAPSAVSAHADETAWALLGRGGVAALMRHAEAPGTGDPPNFRLEDCATQRNLSAAGRDQAVAIGRAFRARSVPVAGVLSSRWCRCLDTARLAFGTVTPFAPLDSFFADRTEADGRTEAVRRRLTAWDGRGVLVLVTHQVNITALTGIVPRQGEVVIVRPGRDGGLEVAGRLLPD